MKRKKDEELMQIIQKIFYYIKIKLECNNSSISFNPIDYYSLTNMDIDIIHNRVRLMPYSEEKILFNRLYKNFKTFGDYIVTREMIEKTDLMFNGIKITREEIDKVFTFLEENSVICYKVVVNNAIVRYMRGQPILPFKDLEKSKDNEKNFTDLDFPVKDKKDVGESYN